MSFFENTRKPVGLGGKLMVAMMNLGHTPVATWGLEFLHLSPDAKVLDCGCGGGANIKRLLKNARRVLSRALTIPPSAWRGLEASTELQFRRGAAWCGRAAWSVSSSQRTGSMQ